LDAGDFVVEDRAEGDLPIGDKFDLPPKGDFPKGDDVFDVVFDAGVCVISMNLKPVSLWLLKFVTSSS